MQQSLDSDGIKFLQAVMSILSAESSTAAAHLIARLLNAVLLYASARDCMVTCAGGELSIQGATSYSFVVLPSSK